MSEPTEIHRRWRRRSAIFSRPVARGVIVLLEDESALLVGSPGDRLWSLLENPVSVGEAAGELSRLFEADEATVRSDVQNLIDDLARKGLLE